MEGINNDQPKIVESIFLGKFLVCVCPKLTKLSAQKHLKQKRMD